MLARDDSGAVFAEYVTILVLVSLGHVEPEAHGHQRPGGGES